MKGGAIVPLSHVLHLTVILQALIVVPPQFTIEPRTATENRR